MIASFASTNLGVFCYASESCVDTDINIPDGNVYCSAKAACKSATIRAKEVRAGSVLSLQNAMIYGASDISISGFYALHGTIIDSDGVTNMEVNMWGNSGGNSGTIICRSGSTCSIDCQGNGCNGLTLQCLTGSICNVSPSGCTSGANSGDAKINGVDCPEWQQSTNDDMDKEMITEARNRYNQYKLETYDKDEEDLLSIEPDFRKYKGCDDMNECQGQTVDSSTFPFAIFLGANSCKNCDIDYNDDVLCYGYRSCLLSTKIYTSTNNIECRSSESCRRAGLISSEKTVICSGPHSCANIDSIESRQGNIKGSGYFAMYSAGNIIAKKDVRCEGESSCAKSSISSNKNIYCDGYDSCRGSNLTSTHITCDAFSACQRTIIYARQNLYLHGSLVADASIMTARNIYGYGSFPGSIIDSKDLNTMTILLQAYRAGYNSDIICRSGARCHLTCRWSGCISLRFKCLMGSICTVDAGNCTNSVAQVNGISCPTVTRSTSQQQDEDLLRRIGLNDNEESFHNEIIETEKQNHYKIGRNTIAIFSFISSGIFVMFCIYLRCNSKIRKRADEYTSLL